MFVFSESEKQKLRAYMPLFISQRINRLLLLVVYEYVCNNSKISYSGLPSVAEIKTEEDLICFAEKFSEILLIEGT